MSILWVLLFAITVVVGVHQGRVEAKRSTRAITAVVLLVVSNVIASWPYFVPGLLSKLRTFYTGLILGGLPLLVFNVAPFFVAYHLTRWVVRRRGGNDNDNDPTNVDSPKDRDRTT